MTNLKLSLIAGLAALGTAAAQTPAPAPAAASYLKITASTSLVTVAVVDGKTTEKLTPAATALPGQTLELRQNVVNVSTFKIGQIKLNQVVPAATLYQSNSCDVPGVKALFSADPLTTDPKTGATNLAALQFSERPTKSVTVKENGADVKRTVAATPADYTAVRWSLPDLMASKTVNCSVRVKVR